MLNPVSVNAVAKARRDDVLRQVEAYRQAGQAQGTRHGPSNATIMGLVGLLAGTGARRKERQAAREATA